MNSEHELVTLENELKALKATYPVAASSLRFYIVTSQTFNVTSTGSQIRIKFTATFGGGKTVFVRLRAVVENQGQEVFREQVTEPQDGTGNVVIRIDLGATQGINYKVRVIANGSSTGVFSML